MDLDKPIFLIGAGRSGSTLVHKILSEHPEVAWLTGISNKFPGHPSLGNLLMHVVGLPAIGQTLRQLAPPGEGYVFWEHHCRGFRRPMRDLSAADVTPRARQQVRAAFDTIRTERRRRLVLKITGWPRIRFSAKKSSNRQNLCTSSAKVTPLHHAPGHDHGSRQEVQRRQAHRSHIPIPTNRNRHADRRTQSLHPCGETKHNPDPLTNRGMGDHTSVAPCTKAV